MVCAWLNSAGNPCPQCWPCSGNTGRSSSTLSAGFRGRWAPRWPGCPPTFRLLFLRRPRSRGAPASPSEEGGLEEFVEFCLRSASCRSKSAICFSLSTNRRSSSAISSACPVNSWRNASISRRKRSFRGATFLGIYSRIRGFRAADAAWEGGPLRPPQRELATETAP